jgi:hypothetical protein
VHIQQKGPTSLYSLASYFHDFHPVCQRVCVLIRSVPTHPYIQRGSVCGYNTMRFSAFILVSTSLLSNALPSTPKLSADSISIFDDPKIQYPTVRDALFSLCRNVADLKRTYELDQHYRARELDRVVRGNLDVVCGMFRSVDENFLLKDSIC